MALTLRHTVEAKLVDYRHQAWFVGQVIRNACMILTQKQSLQIQSISAKLFAEDNETLLIQWQTAGCLWIEIPMIGIFTAPAATIQIAGKGDMNTLTLRAWNGKKYVSASCSVEHIHTTLSMAPKPQWCSPRLKMGHRHKVYFHNDTERRPQRFLPIPSRLRSHLIQLRSRSVWLNQTKWIHNYLKTITSNQA